MRRDLWLAAVIVVMGCSGSDATTGGGGDNDAGGNDATIPGQDGGGTDSTVQNDTGSPGDSGAGTDTGTGADVGPAIDGGKPSDPGQVNCGTASCPTASSYCCIRFQFDGGVADASCVQDDAGIGACFGTRERCNESADCDAGDVCCDALGIGGTGGSQCARPGNNRACGIGEVQLCRTDAECGDAGCSVRLCGTQQLEVCGKPTGCQ